LFVYVKPQHSRLVEGLDTFVDALISAAVSGPDGYLTDRGLIPLTATERSANLP
jgi:phosphate transport system substrate-binding protein